MSIHLGDVAPDSTADTTDGEISFHDWKAGSWAVLFGHPADHTPVCTTELGRTAARENEFAKRNPNAIARSVDPIEDHQGWAPDIGEVSGTPPDLPITADPDERVSERDDMIHRGEGDTSTVRSVFVIDPENEQPTPPQSPVTPSWSALRAATRSGRRGRSDELIGDVAVTRGRRRCWPSR